jgi:IS4 transposase
MWLTTRSGTKHHAWRLHTHFELDKSVPTRMDLTVGRNSGDSDERCVLQESLAADRCYVMDRGYAKFTLFNAIGRIGSSYVCRVRDNSVYELIQERPLGDADQEAQVKSDQIIGLGKTGKSKPDHPVRLVCVRTTPHHKRSNRKGNTGAGPSDGVLRIATNLLDVPAHIIALLYQYRFTIEVFFRFFKHVLGCRHLISDSPRGITIQVYCAIMACMLIALYTRRKPTLRTYEMVCYYFTGLADQEELLRHLAQLQPQA